MALPPLVAAVSAFRALRGRLLTWDQVTQSNFQFAPAPENCTWTMSPPVTPDAKGLYPVATPGRTKCV